MTKDLWMDLAKDNMNAARLLVASHPRSTISRAYYAAFAAGHAMMLHMGQEPRKDLGTWAHKTLPGAVSKALGDAKVGQTRANAMEKQLATCFKQRGLADYAPHLTVNEKDSALQIRHAGRFVKAATEFMR